jgi:hypothetical protein
MDITIILSELSDVAKVRKYYTRSTDLIPIMKQRQKEVMTKLRGIEEAAEDIPSLL